MLKKTLGLACLTLSMGANAAIYDLDADTNERAGGNGDGKEIWYDSDGTSGPDPVPGLVGDFRLSAYNYTSGSPYDDAVKKWAYLDHHPTLGKDGGGACRNAGTTCAGDPDDNVSRAAGFDEMLGLEITNGEFIEAFSLWGDHEAYLPSQVLIDTDGFGIGSDFVTLDVSYTFGGEAFFDLVGEGISSSQLFITPVDQLESSQFYLSAVYTGGDLPPIPVPAAAWLFGSALLGLVAVKRRKA